MKILFYFFIQLCVFQKGFSDTPVNAPICENTISLQYKSEYPLCGNGILDPDELCDDGNTENGDGCNSMCNMYDAFTSTCTLAGKNEACFNDKTGYGANGMPWQVSFCDLKSIDIHPNASYALIVDQNIIIKYNLFTDDNKNIISLFSVPKTFNFICSINIFPDDLSVLIFDGSSHELYLSSSTGNSGYSIATLPSYVQPYNKLISPTFKPLVISKSRLAVTAAISKNASQPLITGFETCVYIFKFNIPTIQVLQQQSHNNHESTPFQKIPCIIYNVMEGLKLYPTYSIKNMIPKYILYERCIQPYLLNSNCYTLYMYRDDFHFLTAYIPEQGGIDIAYTLKSKDIMTNAIGFPIIKYYDNIQNKLKYTLKGNCFSVQNLMLTPKSKLFPDIVTLGDSCKGINENNYECATPLNNPFITNIIQSPYLIPTGLLSSHTHWYLSKIFQDPVCSSNYSSTVLNSNEYSVSSASYYNNVLSQVWSNTIPVDFVQLPNTHDIMFITKTSVGMITSKQYLLFDPKNVGYCKLHDAIFCKPDYYGSTLNRTCYLCNDTKSPGYGVSVPWQMNCAYKHFTTSKSSNSNIPISIRAAPHSPSFEKLVTILSKTIDQTHIYNAICTYLTILKEECPSISNISFSEKQQFNYDADYEDSSINTGQSSNILCLIKRTEAYLKKNLSSQYTKRGEYLSTYSSVGANLIKASAFDFSKLTYSYLRDVPFQNKFYNETALTNYCFSKLFSFSFNMKSVQAWLECAIPFIINSTSISQSQKTVGRRLLQVNAQPPEQQNLLIGQNQRLSQASSTPVFYQSALVLTPTVPSPLPPPVVYDREDTMFPMWGGLLIGAITFMVLILFLCFYYRQKLKKII